MSESLNREEIETRIAELERENEENATAAEENALVGLGHWRALEAAQAQVAALVEWARKSGHRAGCDALRNWERDCDCGLRALLASRPGGKR